MVQPAKKVRPLNGRVVIKRRENEQTTQGGIIIPDTAQEKTQLGIVVAIGESKSNIKTGDNVLFGKYSGTEIRLDNEDFLILKEDEILGIIEK